MHQRAPVELPASFQKLTLAVATILTGLAAGFFASYAYSVTRALGTVDDSTYVTTFQAINATIRSPEFGVIFFGSLVALLVALMTVLLSSRTNKRAVVGLVFALCTYAATLVITFSIHIPLNNTLASVSAAAPEAARLGREAFEIEWNQMHLVRTVTALATFIATTFALISLPASRALSQTKKLAPAA